MATMNITVTVNCNGIIWSRTASVEVDTASMQDGNSGGSITFGTEATTTTSYGMHSYSGIGVGVFTNKARGAVGVVSLFNSDRTVISTSAVMTYLPLIVYSGAGTGFTGAFDASATGTDTPDEDICSVTMSTISGARRTTALVGLKAIS
jgi:hypothetical protein